MVSYGTSGRIKRQLAGLNSSRNIYLREIRSRRSVKQVNSNILVMHRVRLNSEMVVQGFYISKRVHNYIHNSMWPCCAYLMAGCLKVCSVKHTMFSLHNGFYKLRHCRKTDVNEAN